MYAPKFITRYHNKFEFVANSLNQRCISMLLYLNIVSDESIKVRCNILYLNMVIDDNFKESTNVCCISHMYFNASVFKHCKWWINTFCILNMVIDDNFKESTNVCCISHMINCLGTMADRSSYPGILCVAVRWDCFCLVVPEPQGCYSGSELLLVHQLHHLLETSGQDQLIAP